MAVISIDSEEIAWATLDAVLKREIDTDDLTLSFKGADWANFKVLFSGARFEHSLTASSMQGLVEYQFAIYRSIALLLKNYASAGSLKYDQKEKYELVFKIGGGSTSASADGKELVEGLNSATATEAVKKMSGRQITICILVFLLCSYGSAMYAGHLASATEDKRISSQEKKDDQSQEIIKKLIEADREKTKILERAVRNSEKAAQIVELQEVAFDAIIKNTSGADYIELQGRRITREQLDKLNRQTRRKPKLYHLDKNFIIRAVEPLEDGTFNVKLEDSETGEKFTAALSDPISIEKSKKSVQFAEWNHKPIRMQITAKNKGDGYYEAEINRAFRTARSEN